MIEDTETIWSGVPIPFDADIPIAAGWNIIAYYPTFPLSAQAPDFPVLAPIIENVRLAKNGLGQFLSTEFEFSNMPDWRESEGYLINVTEDVIFSYPEDDNRANRYAEVPTDPTGEVVTTTSANMSILITGLEGIKATENDWLMAYHSNGIKVGAGQFDSYGRCGVAIWSDDDITEQVDGLLSGEAFNLKFWDASEGVETKLDVAIIHEGKGLVYADKDFLVVEMRAKEQIPTEYYLSDCYPNPFNNQTLFSFGLPETSEIRIGIFDINGRLVTEIVKGTLSAGQHTLAWQAEGLAAGIYFIHLNVGNKLLIRKILLIK